MVEHVMSHLVSHHGLDLFGRTAIEQIVVKHDSFGAQKSADVGADSRGLLATRRLHTLR